MCNIFAAIGGDDDHIFDTNTEFTGQIDAGLGRTHHAGLHNRHCFGAAVGGFVDLQTQAVADAVSRGILTRDMAKKILIVAAIAAVVIGVGILLYNAGAAAMAAPLFIGRQKTLSFRVRRSRIEESSHFVNTCS